MNFTEHTYEIWKVAQSRDVDVGVAYDMFRTDAANGEARPYNTGTSLPGFDFKAAKADWDAMKLEEKKAACEEWHDFMGSEYNAVCEAFSNGPEAVKAVVNAWQAQRVGA